MSNTPQEIMRKKTIRSLSVGITVSLIAAVAWGWITNQNGQSEIDELPMNLRSMLEWNESIARTLFLPFHLAPEFGAKRIEPIHPNGDIGLNGPIGLKDWKLHLEGAGRSIELSLDDLKHDFPQVEMTAQLHCIEGWSAINQWKGVRLSDVLRKYNLISEEHPAYIALETPDKAYYVGIDGKTAMHPQTLLAYEQNGAILSQFEGFPLRLATPLKYGIKNIKRIGTIRVTSQRPPDYWAEQSYDWYSGL